MTIAEGALRRCLKDLGDISKWQWENKGWYSLVQTWVIVAKALNFPVDDFEIEVIEGRHGIDFIQRWLNENP